MMTRLAITIVMLAACLTATAAAATATAATTATGGLDPGATAQLRDVPVRSSRRTGTARAFPAAAAAAADSRAGADASVRDPLTPSTPPPGTPSPLEHMSPEAQSAALARRIRALRVS
jgi:hypothetical protein